MELVFHLFYIKDWNEINNLLTDFDYFQAKSKSGMTFDLVEEINRFLTIGTKSREETVNFTQLRRFFTNNNTLNNQKENGC